MNEMFRGKCTTDGDEVDAMKLQKQREERMRAVKRCAGWMNATKEVDGLLPWSMPLMRLQQSNQKKKRKIHRMVTM